LSDFNETSLFSIDFRKYSNIKFHENPSSGSPVVACGRTGGRQTDMRKIIVAFRSFANAPKKDQVLCRVQVGNCVGTHMRRNIDKTSNVQYVGSNVCEYEYARRTRGNTI